MFYAGRDNKTYRKYAKYRDWLYAIDDMVKTAIDISLFSLVSKFMLDCWYAEGISSYEVAMYVIVKGVI